MLGVVNTTITTATDMVPAGKRKVAWPSTESQTAWKEFSPNREEELISASFSFTFSGPPGSVANPGVINVDLSFEGDPGVLD